MSQGAVYTGLAINQAQTRLYAANGAGTGSVDVFNRAFNPVQISAFMHLELQPRSPPATSSPSTYGTSAATFM